MADYTIGKEIGAGAQAKVFLGVSSFRISLQFPSNSLSPLFPPLSNKSHKTTGQKVALKQFQDQFKLGLSIEALREIKLLRELSIIPHKNILQLIDVFEHDNFIYLALEFCPADKFKDFKDVILSDKIPLLSPSDIKAYMHMLLNGIAHCHERYILHRDLKPENILIGSEDGELKIADFGLGKGFSSPNSNLTDLVVTLWYRAPELIFGARQYGGAIDIWSLGCIFAELMLRVPIWQGKTEMDQLRLIFGTLGTPNEVSWPGVTSLPFYVEFKSQPKFPLRYNFIKLIILFHIFIFLYYLEIFFPLLLKRLWIY